MVTASSPIILPEHPPWSHPDYRFDGFETFSRAIQACYKNVLTSVDNYQEASHDLFADLEGQNVRYVEISIGPRIPIEAGLDLQDVVRAVKDAAPSTMIVSVICGLNRDRKYDLDHEIVQTVLNTDGVDGIDLHGDETVASPAEFAEIYAEAHSRGFITKAHGGELAGPESIEAALDHLKVTRIGHGVTAIRNEALMSRLAGEQITLDLCLTSNLKLGVVNELSNHPIRTLKARNIPITVSTDDPTIFGSSLSNELSILIEVLDFSFADVTSLQANAFSVAKMEESDRASIIGELKELMADLSWE